MIGEFGDVISSADSQTSNAEGIEICLDKIFIRIEENQVGLVW